MWMRPSIDSLHNISRINKAKNESSFSIFEIFMKNIFDENFYYLEWTDFLSLGFLQSLFVWHILLQLKFWGPLNFLNFLWKFICTVWNEKSKKNQIKNSYFWMVILMWSKIMSIDAITFLKIKILLLFFLLTIFFSCVIVFLEKLNDYKENYF